MGSILGIFQYVGIDIEDCVMGKEPVFEALEILQRLLLLQEVVVVCVIRLTILSFLYFPQNHAA